MKLMRILILVILAGVMLAACAPASPAVSTPTPLPPTPVESKNLPPKAALEAQKTLAQRLGIPVEQVQISEIEQVQWPDACLGLAKPDEMCAQVIVDGFRVELNVDGTLYTFHTNMEGDQLREQEMPDHPAAVLAAVQALAAQLGVQEDAIGIASYEAVDWPDSCLGVSKPDVMCLMVITPGYRVILEHDNVQYEFHTDERGGVVVPAMAPLPLGSDPVITLEQSENGICNKAEIGFVTVSFGPCGGSMTQVPLSEARRAQLAEMVSDYASVSAVTKAGTLEFRGNGQAQPGEAEQRALAEWASLVRQEAEGGRGGAAWGLAIAWQRSGGIAGFCDDLGVYLTGWADAASCKGTNAQPLGGFQLNAEQLEQLYAWVDQYQSFEYTQADAATADAMKITLAFTGEGDQTAPKDVQQQIADFAAALYAETAR